MASFQMNRDNKEKENLNEISGVVAKQPLAVIGGMNENSSKRDIRNVGNIKVDENAGTGVVKQLKTFSVYEDSPKTNANINTDKPLANLAEKEKILCNITNFHQLRQPDFNLVAPPMAVNDEVTPMCVNRSMDESSSSSSGDQLTDPKDVSSADVSSADVSSADVSSADESSADESPVNDRQRFFDVVQYQQDILQNLLESEKKYRPEPQYMRHQIEINYSLRSILIGWLVEVAEEYKLNTETLYLSVSYLDRFLSKMSVKRSKLQLVGTAAMYVASKYEETYPPDASEFIAVTDNSYTKEEVLRMEQLLLKTISFNLCTPTAYVYVNTYAAMCDMPQKLKYLTLYISELSLLEGATFMQYLPSIISSAAVAIARHILGMPMWTKQLEEITTYTLDQLKDVALKLCMTHKSAKHLNTQAISRKYNRNKYKKVASIESVDLSGHQIDILLQSSSCLN